jgi:hypothetical protein
MKMDNTQTDNLPPFVYIGIDKITLGTESKNLNYHNSPPNLKGIIDIIHHGNWSELNIQWEKEGNSNIDLYRPWYSIITALQYGISVGLFKEPLKNYLGNCIFEIMNYRLPLNYFIKQFIETGTFKLDEYEIFFDFYNYNPFFSFDEEVFTHIANSSTIYTRDYKIKRRSNGEFKSTRRSMFSVYDRGLKIGSQHKITRCEIRICDERAKIILKPEDILYPLYCFIDKYGSQIKSILKRYIPEGSIIADNEYIWQQATVLFKLVYF